MTDVQPTVLFVDDEPGILKSLRRLFVDEEWHILLADSGAAGLEILAGEKVDLIVSDVRMPGMDGIEFFSQVKKRYPAIIRIFLSGYAERESVASALAEGYALQILPKPWNDDELREVIKNALNQSPLLPCIQNGLPRIIDSLANLPPLPEVYLKLKNCLADRENFTVDQVVEIIRHDMALSADLLRWSNSALFGQRRKVDTVKRAVMLLGIDIVESLVLSESISRTLGATAAGSKMFDAPKLQRHSMSCAILARLLVSPTIQDAARVADQTFIAGLLHDIGLLAEITLFHEQFALVEGLLKHKKLSLVEAERQILQTSHAEIGALLSERWSLPPFLVNVIRWHHQPLEAPQDKELAIIVATADLLVNRFGNGIESGQQVPEFEQELLDHCQLTPQRLDQLRQDLDRNLDTNNNGT
ncbi:MAG: HDOD domain-containing protein [Desulfuromonadales bacterium]|nr:HDOD domain-containing protein [Desulfuromonadales bacterium]